MGSSAKVPMTIQEKKKLEDELKRLLQVERPSVIKAIEDARSLGDISENADYDAAKERQAWIEARIGEIQGNLVSAEVVDTAKIKSTKIVFGASVVLLDVEAGEESTYQIVGFDEADVKAGKLSVMSALARSLIGKVAGDSVEVQNPKGIKEYEIIKFFYR